MEGQTFKCTKSELLPPKSNPLFAIPFDQGGYNSTQICPVTSGEQYLLSRDAETNNVYKVWWFLVLLGFFALYQVLAYAALYFCSWEEQAPTTAAAMVSKKDEKKSTKAATHRNSENNDSDSDIESGNKIEEAELGEEATVSKSGYLSWRHLYYEVSITPTWWKFWNKKKLQLLNDVSGYVKPGMMLALMGPSGAGKSTLLDVLARRKTEGKVKGEILVNGKPVNDIAFAHQMGYVEQQNLHIMTVTVREAIEFSANLRLIESSSKTADSRGDRIKRHVEWVLDSVDLRGISSAPLFECSFEQLKRVTIAVELAADPAILFLDEPTSGLSAREASMVMKCISKIAAAGKSVVCTIHQPTEAVFGLFSHLLLLKPGGIVDRLRLSQINRESNWLQIGEVIYFGEVHGGTKRYSTLLDYCSNSLGHPMKAFRNPADHVLDMCSLKGNEKSHDSDPAAIYQHSTFYTSVCSILDEKRLVPDGKEEEQKAIRRRYIAPGYLQFWWLLRRSFSYYWRQPKLVKLNTLSTFCFGALLGLMFFFIPHDQQGTAERISLIFFTVLLGSVGMSSIIPLIIGQRPTFARERAASAYRPALYILAQTLVTIPFAFVAMLVLVIPAYFVGGLRYDDGNASHFFFFLFVSFLLLLFYLGMNMFVAVWLPTIDAATASSGTFTAINCLFAGFLLREPQIPNYWIWLYWVSPLHYALEALVINEFEGNTFHCHNNEGALFVSSPSSPTNGTYYCPVTSGSAYVESFGFDLDARWRDVGLLGGEIVIVFLLVIIGILFIKHIRR